MGRGSWLVMRSGFVSAACVLIGGATLACGGSPGSSSTSSDLRPSPSETRRVAASTTQVPGGLSDVSCPTSSFCMTVGFTDTFASALAYRFDGTSWSVSNTPDPPSGWRDVSLSAVSCPSASFCAAVGTMSKRREGARYGVALIAEVWNGQSWRYLPIERPGQVFKIDLDCPTTKVCVAVGFRTLSGDVTRAEAWVLHAGTFHLVAPVRPSGNSELRGVSCRSAINCTAVGGAGQPDGQPLIERWNGTAWHQTRTPPAPRGYRYDGAYLSDVSCPQVGSCVAVGDAGYDRVGSALVAYRYEGGPWHAETVAASKGDTDLGADLYAISCLNYRRCAAVGGYLANECCPVPIIAWRDRATPHFTADWPPDAQFGAGSVSCVATSCTYVGSEWVDEAVTPDPPQGPAVLYRGTGLHPVRQTLPQPTR